MLSGLGWTVAKPEPDLVKGLVDKFNFNPITAACLVNRGISDPSQVEDFLSPQLSQLDKPDNMVDLGKAVNRIGDAVANREKVGVFGDYDVDGLTSAALVTLFLQQLGLLVETAVANRFSGGYGLDKEVVIKMVENGCSLLVILDCGSSDHESIEKAAELGLDVIIVDHHRIEGSYPKAVAFVNPQRKDCAFEDKNLAAVGLAFYFCSAVRTKLAQTGVINRDQIDPRQFLDLVALGTIADVVTLRGNNRILAKHGLKYLSKIRRPGIEALININRIRSRVINAAHISYQLAPKINAAGRLANAYDAFELLVTKNFKEAARLASVLEKFTLERRKIEEGVTKEARKQAYAAVDRGDKVIIVFGDNWHKGVLGIVAARLTEEFGRPTYVTGFDNDNGTGSARAQGQLNLYKSLQMVSKHLVRFGGHKEAAGYTITRQKMDSFRQALNEYAQDEIGTGKMSQLVCDAQLYPFQLTTSLLQELQQLGPFGHGNPEPVFDILDLDVLQCKVVGVNHMKLELKTPSGTISAFGPRFGEFCANMPPLIRVAASISTNEWRGNGALELKLVKPPVKSENSDYP